MRWNPGDSSNTCCDPCPPVHVQLTSGTDLAPEWECDDLDNVAYVTTDQVTVSDDFLRVIQSLLADDSTTAVEPLGETAIATTSAATYNGNRTIKFSTHATEYTVVRHAGNVLTITPGLTEEVPAATTISDVSPTTSFPGSDAYYIQHLFKTTTGVTKIHQGSTPDHTLEIDIANETQDFDSETQQDLPPALTTQWQWANFYICPTHTMGEALVVIDASDPSLTNATGSYGNTMVNDSSPTVNDIWELEAEGDVTFYRVIYYPADVSFSTTYDAGYELLSDCGRFDLFPCPWQFWKQYLVTAEMGTPPIDMALTGWDEPTESVSGGFTFKYGDRIGWHPISGTKTPADPPDAFGLNPCQMISYRMHELDSPTVSPTESGIAYYLPLNTNRGLKFEATAVYSRDLPTKATPYPLPKSVANLVYRDIRPERNEPGCDRIQSVTSDLGNAEAISDSFTLAVTLEGSSACTDGTIAAEMIRDADSTITWTHPAV